MPVSVDIRHAVEEVPSAPVAHLDTGWDLKEYIILGECGSSNENRGQSHQLLSSPLKAACDSSEGFFSKKINIFWFGSCADFQV